MSSPDDLFFRVVFSLVPQAHEDWIHTPDLHRIGYIHIATYRRSFSTTMDFRDNKMGIYIPIQKPSANLIWFLKFIGGNKCTDMMFKELIYEKERGTSMIQLLEDKYNQCVWCGSTLSVSSPPGHCVCTYRKCFPRHPVPPTRVSPRIERTVPPRVIGMDGVCVETMMMLEALRPDRGNSIRMELTSLVLTAVKTKTVCLVIMSRRDTCRPRIPRLPPLFSVHDQRDQVHLEEQLMMFCSYPLAGDRHDNQRFFTGREFLLTRKNCTDVTDFLCRRENGKFCETDGGRVVKRERDNWSISFSNNNFNVATLYNSCQDVVLRMLIQSNIQNVDDLESKIGEQLTRPLPFPLSKIISFAVGNRYLFAYLAMSLGVPVAPFEWDFLERVKLTFGTPRVSFHHQQAAPRRINTHLD